MGIIHTHLRSKSLNSQPSTLTSPLSYAEAHLLEFDQEMASTRKAPERIPDDKLDWRAHPKSNTMGWNANHLADLPGWGVSILTQPGFDFAHPDGPRYQ